MKNSICLLIVFLIAFTSSGSAQWIRTNGPSGGTINAFAANSNYLFAGTEGGGVYRTQKGIIVWTAANSGIENETVLSLAATDNALFAGTYSSVFRSTDNGGTWEAITTPGMGFVTALQVSDGTSGTSVFAGTHSGFLFYSSDNGVNWKMNLNAGNAPITAIAVSGSYLYVANAAGVYRSTDHGTSWDPRTLRVDITSLIVNGSEVFAGTNGVGVYHSSDNGGTWMNVGLKTLEVGYYGSPPVSIHPLISALALLPASGGLGQTMLCAGTYFGIFVSAVGDSNWTRYDNGMRSVQVKSLMVDDASLFAGTKEAGVHVNYLNTRYTPNDPTIVWFEVNSGLRNPHVYSIACQGTSVFAATGLGGVQVSADYGASWVEVNKGLRRETILVALAVDRGVFVLGDSSSYRFADIYSPWVRQPWDSPREKWPWEDIGNNGGIVCTRGSTFSWSNGTAGYGPYQYTYGGVSRSTWNDDLQRWEWGVSILNGLPHADPFSSVQIYALGACDSILFISTVKGLYRSIDSGDWWVAVDTSAATKANPATALAVGRDGTGKSYVVKVVAGNAFLSQDLGWTWANISDGFPDGVTALAISPNGAGGMTIYAGTTNRGVFRYPYGNLYSSTIAPLVETNVTTGDPFWVSVSIGDSLAVSNLHSISFKLNSNQPFCTYIDSSATYGPFLVDTVWVLPFGHVRYLSPTIQSSKVDPQTVLMGLTKQGSTGANGQGIVAQAQFTSLDSRSSLADVQFSLSNVYAMTFDGQRIYLRPSTESITVGLGHAAVWPGDCNNDGLVDAADVLPLGLYFGRSFGAHNSMGTQWRAFIRDYWQDEPPGREVYSDANGDGIVNSLDLLAIGLNYGHRRPVTTNSVQIANVKTKTIQRASDGGLLITSVMRPQADNGYVHARVVLRAAKPVYGLAFKVKYAVQGVSTTAVRLVDTDTTRSALGGGLMLSRASDSMGEADIGITRTDGIAFVGESTLMDLLLDVSVGKETAVQFAICNVTGNDAKGNTVQISGSDYREGLTSLEQQVPLVYALKQNYPNPFNPSTTLGYEVPTSSFVTMKVFDVLGREVATLVNEVRAAGRYSIQWNASAMPSGVYYYRMTARESTGKSFTQTRRMILVK